MKDKATKLPKLNCRNWECGVLVPTRSVAHNLGHELDASIDAGLLAFKSTVPVPMQYPGNKYDGREPWYFQEHE